MAFLDQKYLFLAEFFSDELGGTPPPLCNVVSPNDAAFIGLDCPDNGVIGDQRSNCHERKKNNTQQKISFKLSQRGKPPRCARAAFATGVIVLGLPAPRAPVRRAAPGKPPSGAAPSQGQGEDKDEDEDKDTSSPVRVFDC